MSEQESKSESIEPGQLWEHAEGGLYKVLFVGNKFEHAEGFEETGELVEGEPFVYYVQLTDGKLRPAGSEYDRSPKDFLEHMKKHVEPEDDSARN